MCQPLTIHNPKLRVHGFDFKMIVYQLLLLAQVSLIIKRISYGE